MAAIIKMTTSVAKDIAPAVPALAVKTNDESEQVQAQRHDPQERNHRHILADLIGDRQQTHGTERGQHQPQQDAWIDRRSTAPAPGFSDRAPCGRGQIPPAIASATPPLNSAKAGSRTTRAGSAHASQRPARSRTDTTAAPRATDVGQRVEPVRDPAVECPAVPGLHQRRGSGQQEVGQPDVRGQQHQNAPAADGIAVGRLPRGAGRIGSSEDSRRRAAARSGSPPRYASAGSDPTRGHTRSRPAEDLKEQHARRPDGRARRQTRAGSSC